MSQPRVEVLSGDWERILGHGRLVGHVDVWVYKNRSGRLMSRKNAEYEPLLAEARDMEAVGARLVCIPSNPKIVLDDGEVVYGCQVWWRFLDESVEPLAEAELKEPPPVRIQDVVVALAGLAEAEGWPAAMVVYETVLLEQMRVGDWWWVRRIKGAIKKQAPHAPIGDKTALDIYTALALFMASNDGEMTRGEHDVWGSIRNPRL